MNKTPTLSEKQCSTWPSSQTDEGQVLKTRLRVCGHKDRNCSLRTPEVRPILKVLPHTSTHPERLLKRFYTLWRSSNYLIIRLIYWRSLLTANLKPTSPRCGLFPCQPHRWQPPPAGGDLLITHSILRQVGGKYQTSEPTMAKKMFSSASWDKHF